MARKIVTRSSIKQMHSCRSCMHCAWKEQYCKAMDSDLGSSFMRSLKACPNYERYHEEY